MNASKVSQTYEKPHQANAPNPMAMMMHDIVPNGVIKKAADIKNTVCAKKPPQLKYRRVCVVVR